MPGAFEIVMDHRKQLVEKIVGMMEAGYHFNTPEWSKLSVAPHNPLSKCRYKGGNRLRLMLTAAVEGYADPRWATLKQYKDKGYFPKKGEHGTLCEKWIFTRERTIINQNGEKEKVTEELEYPKVSYFIVFNAQQMQGFPEIKEPQPYESSVFTLADQLLETSECPIEEIKQDRAYYSLTRDKIVLPPRNYFKDDISFVKTMLHEMGHSTGHPARLNRDLSGVFGSPNYAKEELRAELSALFLGADFGIPLSGEHYEDHSDYLKSWIRALREDYNELFRACADAEKISERIRENYEKKYTIEPVMEEIPDREQNKTVEKKKYSDKRPASRL